MTVSEGLRIAWWIGLGVCVCPGAGQAENDRDRPPFDMARPGFVFEFPRDHGSHQTFQTEWWYVTGHLVGSQGERFGYELTFFRRGLNHADARNNPSAWAIRQVYLAHFALTLEDHQSFFFADKISRAGVGKAGAQEKKMHVWIDRWFLKAEESDHQRLRLFAREKGMGIDLMVEPVKPPVIQGTNGVSQKGPQSHHASHYYSLTRLRTSGSIRVNGTVIPVTGVSWLDHEFGSGDLADHLVGWDWFSLQLENNREIMMYGLRRQDGTFDPASSGTLVLEDGSTQSLALSDVHILIKNHWTSPASGARYPSQWKFSIPSKGITLDISPTVPGQELITTNSTGVTYWEGAVSVEGQWGTGKVRGQGYVELTGYDQPYRLPDS